MGKNLKNQRLIEPQQFRPPVAVTVEAIKNGEFDFSGPFRGSWSSSFSEMTTRPKNQKGPIMKNRKESARIRVVKALVGYDQLIRRTERLSHQPQSQKGI